MAWYRCVGGAGGSLKLRTASGRIATFETNMVAPFKSLKSDINPVQDLHGYSKPWSGGGGKNKADKANDLPSDSGITITVANDGTLTINGTSTKTCYIRGYFNCPDSTVAYTWALFNNKAFESGVEFSVRTSDNSSAGGWARVNATNKTFSFTPSATPTKWQFQISSGITFNNAVFKPMIVSGNTAPTDYEPYSNICPISGFSALNVTRTGKNLFDNSLMVNSRTTVVGDTVTLTATGNFQGSAYAVMPVKQGYKYALNIDSLTSGSGVEVRRYDASGTVTNVIVITQSTIININDGTTVRISIVYGNRTAGAGTFVLKGFNIALGENYQSYTHYNGQTATVNFGQTVYGGVADVTNGKVEIDFANDRLDEKTWSYNASRGAFNATFSGKDQTRFNEMICSCYENGGFVYSASEVASKPDKAFYTQNNSDTIFIKDSDYTDPTTWLNALGSNTICYPLATPIEITTTPENLTAIVGQNNVYSDTNGDTEVKYLYRG